MTTCLFDRRTMEVGADTQNTTPGGAIVRCHKIEKLKNGWWFLGSGHNYGIGLARTWAETSWDVKKTPDWTWIMEDDDYGMECLVIDVINNKVWLLDSELVPILLSDPVCGVGSGAGFALGAMDAGADMQTALTIAADRDPSTSAPFEVIKIG